VTVLQELSKRRKGKTAKKEIPLAVFFPIISSSSHDSPLHDGARPVPQPSFL
jgi:hypothetical protein